MKLVQFIYKTVHEKTLVIIQQFRSAQVYFWSNSISAVKSIILLNI